MAINFPDSPSLNDVFTSGGVDWKWDGTTWKGVAGTLPTASTTTLGGIKVGTNLSIAAGVLSASGGEVTVQDEGVSLSTAATTLNFEGSGVTATGTGATKTISITGGTSTTINNNAAERVITGSATANTLNAESNLTLATNGTLTLTGSLIVDKVNINDEVIQLSSGTSNLKVRGNGTGGAYHLTLDDDVTVVGDLKLDAGIKDKDGNLGTSGQVLSSTGTQVDWIDPISFARTTASASTSSLANNASANLDITSAAKAYGLLKIQTSVAAYVCLYTSQAARTQDANRQITTDPNPGAGVIAEVMTNAGGTQIISPMLMGYNDEATPINTVYAKVINAHGSASIVTVTLHYIPFET